MVTILVLVAVEIIIPYIWYEKLSSTTIKYIYIMEEYGYLTSKEARLMKDDLEKQGFESDKITLNYTNNKVEYGEPIFLKLSYKYKMKLPLMEEQFVDMVVKRDSVSKR